LIQIRIPTEAVAHIALEYIGEDGYEGPLPEDNTLYNAKVALKSLKDEKCIIC